MAMHAGQGMQSQEHTIGHPLVSSQPSPLLNFVSLTTNMISFANVWNLYK